MANPKLLLIPGPSPVHERILKALGEPTVSHVSQEMQAELKGSCENLKKIVYSAGGESFIVAGSGTLSMEMALLNTAEKGDRILILSQGFFGTRMAEICRAFDLNYEFMEAEPGKAVLPSDLESQLARKRYDLLISTHVDTATGACAPIRDYARSAKNQGALFIVDGVCATAGIEENMDDWGIDVILTAAQKCFGAPPGLALCVFSQRALAKRQTMASVPAYYSDILRWLPVMKDPSRYFSTPCVNEIRSFYESTRIILEEGLESRFKRHALFARAIRSGLESLGFSFFTDQAFLAATLSVVNYPPSVEDKPFREALLKNGVVVAGGLAETAGKVFRLGHMGNLTRDQVLFAMTAVERALVSLGRSFKRGVGAEAAKAVLDAR